MKVKKYLAKWLGLYTKEDMFSTTNDMLKVCLSEVTDLFNAKKTSRGVLNLTRNRLKKLRYEMAEKLPGVAFYNGWDSWFDEHGITQEEEQ